MKTRSCREGLHLEGDGQYCLGPKISPRKTPIRDSMRQITSVIARPPTSVNPQDLRSMRRPSRLVEIHRRSFLVATESVPQTAVRTHSERAIGAKSSYGNL